MLPRKGQVVTAFNTDNGIAFTGKVLNISYDAGSKNCNGWVEVAISQMNMTAKLDRVVWSFTGPLNLD